MIIQTYTVGPIEENTYIVSDETGEAVLIDCGCFAESEWRPMKQYIEDKGLQVKHLLCTHLHFDHTLGNRFVLRDLGLRAEASAADTYLYDDMKGQMALFLGERLTSRFDLDFATRGFTSLYNGDEIKFGHTTFEVIATPGHTPGGLCFYCKDEGILFSGDSLFQGSVGRTDLKGGNYADMIKGLTHRIITLPPETQVYTGHGPSTTIEHELNYNPYL